MMETSDVKLLDAASVLHQYVIGIVTVLMGVMSRIVVRL